MKKTVKLLLAAAILLTAGTTSVQAQKMGYLNSAELMEAMPERDSITKQMQAYFASLQSDFEAMGNEMKTKTAEYIDKKDTYTDLARRQKEKELEDLQTRIDEFRSGVDNDLQQKQAILMKPMAEKLKAAIDKVAKAQGLVCVFDLSTGPLAYYNETTMVNLLPLVKQSLGIK